MSIDTLPASGVLVLWSPGVGRDLAHRLILDQGLPARRGVTQPELHVVNRCEVCGSSLHGRPSLVGGDPAVAQHLSISYAEDLTVVALSSAGPVGVDVERAGAASFPGFDAVVGHKQERAVGDGWATVAWVRKESLLKATGRGLRVDPRGVRLTPPDQPPELMAWDEVDPPKDPVWIYDVTVGFRHVAAVAVLAAERPQVAVRRAAPAAASRGASPGTGS